MKRILVLALLLLAMAATTSEASKFGVGAFAGLNFPVVQDDQASGAIFGFKLRWQAVPLIALEPNMTFSKYGDPEFDEFETSLTGSKVTSYGVDATFGNPVGGMGFKPYLVAGLGFYKQTNEDTDGPFGEPGSKVGFNAGLGFGLGFTPTLDIDVRGQLRVAKAEEAGSKKSAAATVGLNFYFGAK